MKEHKGLKIALIVIGSIFGLLIAFVGCVLIFASATTLKVKDVEKMQVDGAVTAKINKSNNLKKIEAHNLLLFCKINTRYIL